MLRIFSVTIMLLVLVSESHAFHVVVDPGHGGTDTGAARGPLHESKIVLDVALELRELLQKRDGVRVTMTREGDVGLSLPERLKRAENAGADLFVSLHANAAPDSKARGVELFFQNSLPPDEDALYLASLENQTHRASPDAPKGSDLATVVEDLHRQSRLRSSLKFSRLLDAAMTTEGARKGPAIKQAPLFVVSRASMPSVLVELGFITHPEDASRLRDPAHRRGLAAQIERAILEYRQTMHGSGLALD